MDTVHFEIEGDESSCWAVLPFDRSLAVGENLEINAFCQPWRVQVLRVETRRDVPDAPQQWATIRIMD